MRQLSYKHNVFGYYQRECFYNYQGNCLQDKNRKKNYLDRFLDNWNRDDHLGGESEWATDWSKGI